MRSFRSWIVVVMVVAVSASLATGTAHAVGHEGGAPGHFGREPGHFVGGPGHFTGHPAEHWSDYRLDHWDGRWGWQGVDVDRWHGGHWFHGDHLGRLGWWWVVDGGWYFYPTSVSPYPDPYVPPAVAAPSAGYWYYCPSVNAYYPYVTECLEAWTPVLPQAQGS